MIYLILAIVCSVMIAIIMRLSTNKVKGNKSMLATNYAMCFILGILNAGSGGLFPASPALPALAAWAKQLGEVTVVAPLVEQSGKSQALDFRNTV